MGWYSKELYPHEAFDGSIDAPWDEEDVRRQGDNKVSRAFVPFTRPPEEQQDEGFGWPELED